jgi:magnesium transporter
MNFHDMPELGAPFAYPVLGGATLGACILLYILLRRAKWL